MGFFEQFLFHPVAGGFGFISLLALNVWAFRIIRAFQKETREEYRARLRDAILEVEQQKQRNIRLELKLQTMEHLVRQRNEPQ